MGSSPEMEIHGPDSRSFRDLINDIISNVQQMFRAELRLAKANSTKAVKAYAAGAICGLYAGALVLAAVVFFLAYWTPLWLASLIVGVLMGITALILLSAGKRRVERVEKSIQQVKEAI